MENQNFSGDQAAREELLSEFYQMRPRASKIKIDPQAGKDKTPCFCIEESKNGEWVKTPLANVINNACFQYAYLNGPVYNSDGEEMFFLVLQFKTAKGRDCELEVNTETNLACQVARHLPQMKSGATYTFKVSRDEKRLTEAGVKASYIAKMADFVAFADAKDIDYKSMSFCKKGEDKTAFVREQLALFHNAQRERDNEQHLDKIFPDDTADLIGEAGKKKGKK